MNPGAYPGVFYIPPVVMKSHSPPVKLAVFTALASLSLALGFDIHPKEVLYPDGKTKERYTYYKDEKGHEIRDGVDEEFYQDGSKKGSRTWKKDLEDGPVVYFHPNGRKSYETNYTAGKKNGFSTVWYANGQKQWQTTFREGKTNGRWREWYQDGKKKFEADYSDGKLDGLATWWYDNGHIWQERTYENGVPVKGTVKEWDRNGRQTFPPLDGAPAQGEPDAQPTQSGSAVPAPSATPAPSDTPPGGANPMQHAGRTGRK
jgi:antitoxin component YwqK of YwqJK toxin-antitoxin module